jgi:hypothetical protein
MIAARLSVSRNLLRVEMVSSQSERTLVVSAIKKETTCVAVVNLFNVLRLNVLCLNLLANQSRISQRNQMAVFCTLVVKLNVLKRKCAILKSSQSTSYLNCKFRSRRSRTLTT